MIVQVMLQEASNKEKDFLENKKRAINFSQSMSCKNVVAFTDKETSFEALRKRRNYTNCGTKHS